MNTELKAFISDSGYSDNTKFSVERLINRLDELGYCDKVLYHGTENELWEMIIDIKPSSIVALSTYCSLLITYTKWINDNGLILNNTHKFIANFDRISLWRLIKPKIQKFLSHNQFLEIVKEIDKSDELKNSLYYQMLIRTIYEGVYTENLISLANMSTNDFSENTIKVHGKTDYDLTVSENLIDDLRELAQEEYWFTMRGSIECRYKMIGSSDKVFKICQRKNSTWDYNRAAQHFYYKRFRKIADNYIGYKIQPLQIFISGLMWRICSQLTENGIAPMDAFDERNRNKTSYDIISAELARTQYNIRVSDLKFIVRDDIDVFME